MIWQRLTRHEIEVVFAHRHRTGARRHRGLRVERRTRHQQRSDCEWVWEYDDEFGSRHDISDTADDD